MLISLTGIFIPTNVKNLAFLKHISSDFKSYNDFNTYPDIDCKLNSLAICAKNRQDNMLNKFWATHWKIVKNPSNAANYKSLLSIPAPQPLDLYLKQSMLINDLQTAEMLLILLTKIRSYPYLMPEHVYYEDRLAEIQLSDERIDEAIETYKSGIKRNPNYIWNYVKLGDILLQYGSLIEAENQYLIAHAIDQQDISIARRLAIVFRKQGKLKSSENILILALESNPNNIDTMFQLSLTLIEGQRIEDAIQVLHEVVRKDGTFWQGYAYLASLYSTESEMMKATEYYCIAIKLNKNAMEEISSGTIWNNPQINCDYSKAN